MKLKEWGVINVLNVFLTLHSYFVYLGVLKLLCHVEPTVWLYLIVKRSDCKKLHMGQTFFESYIQTNVFWKFIKGKNVFWKVIYGTNVFWKVIYRGQTFFEKLYRRQTFLKVIYGTNVFWKVIIKTNVFESNVWDKRFLKSYI